MLVTLGLEGITASIFYDLLDFLELAIEGEI